MGRWFLLALLVALGVLLTAFTIQNGSHTSALQLDVGFAAWKLKRPVGVPVLMWSSFGAGFGLAGLWGLWRGASLSREVRRLQQEVALAGTAPTGRAKDAWG